jgi:23S rRNA (adenine-N6)-dimethyltransferase
MASSLSYHALRNSSVARRVVAHSGLAPPDLVLEPGAGSGVLTAELARSARKVVAVEADRSHWPALRELAKRCPNVEPVLGDFLELPLPASQPYQVVANLPFSLTAAAVRKLLGARNPPKVAALIVQREAALHWSGAGRESVASVLAKVAFSFDIPLALRRTDFAPFPTVESVLMRMEKRPAPLVGSHQRRAFELLVLTGFGGGRRTASANLRRIATAAEVSRAIDLAGTPHAAAPGEIPFEAWLAIFESLRTDRSGPSLLAPRRRLP